MASPFKNETTLLLGLGALLIAVGIVGILAARTSPTVTLINGSGPSMKPVPVSPIPGSPTIEEPVPGANGSSPTNQLACEDAGGRWNECGSACRNQPNAEACIQVCVAYCECSSDKQCPADANNVNRLKCTDYIDGVGVCKP